MRLLTYVCVLGVGGSACTNRVDPNLTCGNSSFAVPTLRRLSHIEYRNTLRDLFPMLDLPAVSLPADPTPYGWDNDADSLRASPLLISAYRDHAGRVADDVVANRATVLPCSDASADAASACGRQWISDLGARAFRRPVTTDEHAALTAVFDQYLAMQGFANAIRLTTQVILQAPAFLYRVDTGANSANGYDVASRLSYFLWASMPDAELFAAAADGSLLDPTALSAQVDRLMANPKALEGFMTFATQWLSLARIDGVGRPPDSGWSEAVRAALKEEARRFLAEVIFAREGSMDDLLRSPAAFISAETAAFYGLPAPATEWAEVELADRKGFLMQAQFLTATANADQPRIIQRGLFVLRNLMCVDIGFSPPDGGGSIVPPAGQVLTNREATALQTSQATCMGCHVTINPMGFVFEGFDSFGRRRTMDQGKVIDTTGNYQTTNFAGPDELVNFLAESESVPTCASMKFLTYATGTHEAADDTCLVEDLTASLRASGGGPVQLMKTLATHPRFLGLQEGR